MEVNVGIIIKSIAAFSLSFFLLLFGLSPSLSRANVLFRQEINFCGRGVVISDTKLNLRAGPSTSATVTLKLVQGTEFKIEVCNPTMEGDVPWIRVRVNNTSGWVSSKPQYVRIELFSPNTVASPIALATSVPNSLPTVGTTSPTIPSRPSFYLSLIFLVIVAIIGILLLGRIVGFGIRIIQANARVEKQDHADLLFWDAEIVWLIPHLVGWIIVREDEQVGIIGKRVYKKGSFFLSWPFSNTRKNTVSIQERSDDLLGEGVLQNGSKVTLKVRVRYSIKPQHAAELLAARSGILASIKQSLNTAVSNFIRVSLLSSLRKPKGEISDQLNEEFRELLLHCTINIEGFSPDGDLINKIDQWTTAVIEASTSATKNLPQVQIEFIRAIVADGVIQGKSMAEINTQIAETLMLNQQHRALPEPQQAFDPAAQMLGTANPTPLHQLPPIIPVAPLPNAAVPTQSQVPTNISHHERLAWERQQLQLRAPSQLQPYNDPETFTFMLENGTCVEVVWRIQNQPPQVLLNGHNRDLDYPLLAPGIYDYSTVTILDLYRESRRLLNV